MSQELSEQHQPKNSGSKRSLILFGALALMLCALGYDRLVARPGVELAYDKIAAEYEIENAKGDRFMTNEMVSKMVGGLPARTFNDPKGEFVEVYSWRAGLPFKTHDLFVVYQPVGDKQQFVRLSKFVYDQTDQIFAGLSESAMERSLDTESVAPTDSVSFTVSEQENSSSQDNSSGRQRERGFDPEAMFKRNDADGDGKLSGDEIPERMRDGLVEIDTDTDGAVTLEEFRKTLESRARPARPE